MSEVKFKLEKPFDSPSLGLKHFRPPKNIKGKTDHGIKPSLTFYFENKKEKDEVLKFFRVGVSRVPSGKKLLEFVRKIKKETEEWARDSQNTTG